MFYTARERLAHDALRLKKTWLILWAMLGNKPTRKIWSIPQYSDWKRLELESHVGSLKADIQSIRKAMVTDPTRAMSSDVLDWMASRFDAWEAVGFRPFTVAIAQEFERQFGRLTAHDSMEIPPYAELLLQLGTTVAVRHPEYMLARDLEYLFEACQGAEQLLQKIHWDAPPAWAGGASENALTLGRTTILTCFNLLESFVSGLARAHVMTHPELDPQRATKLLSTQDSLRKRVLNVPRQIIGAEPPLDFNKPPLSVLFGEIKPYRDSFVHCEPGPDASSHGYVKEKLFHAVNLELVKKAVATTTAVIQTIWTAVHEKPGPRWLDGSKAKGFGYNLKIVPPTSSD